MSAYRMARTRMTPPASHPREGGTERVNVPSASDFWGRGRLESLGAAEEASTLGQASQRRFLWRGRVPDGCEPDPGWGIEVGRRRCRVIESRRSCFGWWTLTVELVEGRR